MQNNKTSFVKSRNLRTYFAPNFGCAAVLRNFLFHNFLKYFFFQNETNGTMVLLGEEEERESPDLFYEMASQWCHELHEEIYPLLDSLIFWVEGVCLSVVAGIGLLGNLLTVVVILNFDQNTRSPFNQIQYSLRSSWRSCC